MRDIKFSIIIPAHNRSHFLRETIGSVIFQSYKNWECIVVDDGSTDDTRAVVESLDDARIKYLYQDRSERSIARNNGIDHCTGTHVCFLDSDDGYMADHLESLHNTIKSDPGPFLWQTGYMVYNAEKKETILFEQPTNEFKFMFNAPTPLVPYCFDRDVLNEVRFPEEFWIWEDRHFTLRVLAKRPLKIVSKASAIFRDHPQRSMNSLDEDTFRAKIFQMPKAIDDLVDHLGDQILNDISRYEIRKRKCGVLLFNAQTAIQAGRQDLGRLAMQEATRFLDFRRVPRWIVFNLILIAWPVTKWIKGIE